MGIFDNKDKDVYSAINSFKDVATSSDPKIKDLREKKEAASKIRELRVQDNISAKIIHDDRCIILSAPEIIIGNVNGDGTLRGETGDVVVSGNYIRFNGVGKDGSVTTNATTIIQNAIDPGIDGVEGVVHKNSRIISQARRVVLQSENVSEDGCFSQKISLPKESGIRLHADQAIEVEASVSVEKRLKDLDDIIGKIQKGVTEYKKKAEEFIKAIKTSMDQFDKNNLAQSLLTKSEEILRTSYAEMVDLDAQQDQVLASMNVAVSGAFRNLSVLGEANRQLAVLKKEKEATEKKKDKFKEDPTGSVLNVKAEVMNFISQDGDGNIRVNPESSMNAQAANFLFRSNQADGTLTEKGSFKVNALDIGLSTVNLKLDEEKKNGDSKSVGKITVLSKDVEFAARDWTVKDSKPQDEVLTDNSTFTVFVDNAGFSALDKDGNTTGTFDVQMQKSAIKSYDKECNNTGEILLSAKDMTAVSQDKDTAATGSMTVKAEKISGMAVDKDGKANGQVVINGKEVYVKSMDVDATKGTDKNLASGGSMVMVAEKMFVGHSQKDKDSKELTVSSEKMGLYAKNTAEMQQGDGKAVVQLDGGNLSITGSKTGIYGPTTMNNKMEVKGETTLSKATIKNLEVSSAFKSPNIKDGMGGGGGSTSSMNAKLKAPDSPTHKDISMPKKVEKKEDDKKDQKK